MPDDGLYSKFHVHRADGRDRADGDKHGARYFVLDYVHDPYARLALVEYAELCRARFPKLADDIDEVLAQTQDSPAFWAVPDSGANRSRRLGGA